MGPPLPPAPSHRRGQGGGHFLQAMCLGGGGAQAGRSAFPDRWSLRWAAASLFRPFYAQSLALFYICDCRTDATLLL